MPMLDQLYFWRLDDAILQGRHLIESDPQPFYAAGKLLQELFGTMPRPTDIHQQEKSLYRRLDEARLAATYCEHPLTINGAFFDFENKGSQAEAELAARMTLIALLLSVDELVSSVIKFHMCELSVLEWCDTYRDIGRGSLEWEDSDFVSDPTKQWKFNHYPSPAAITRLHQAIRFLKPEPLPKLQTTTNTVFSEFRVANDDFVKKMKDFRRKIIDGEVLRAELWFPILMDLRTTAHSCGLKPSSGVDFIIASMSEVMSSCSCQQETVGPDHALRLMLIPPTGGGCTTRVNLSPEVGSSKPFSEVSVRLGAVEWAESWISAREQQINRKDQVPDDLFVGPADALPTIDGSPEQPEEPTALPRRLPALKPWAMQAWKARQLGMTTKDIAEELSRKYKDPKITQPRVSEQIKKAQEHAEASGLAVDAARALPSPGTPARVTAMDPAAIERGPRTDRRAKTLAEKARQLARDNSDD